MIKSINAWSFPQSDSPEAFFAAAKQCGFTTVEPAFTETGALSLASSDAQVTAVRRLADDMGLSIASLATGLYWQYPPTTADEGVRTQSMALLRRQLECAALLGTDAILIVPGLVTAEVSYEDAYRRASDFLAQALPHAQACGVKMGVENVWNKFLLSPLEMRGFVDQYQSPYVGVYLDVGNLVAFGYPQQWIDILARRILRVHVKDYREAVGTLPGFVDLLSGDVDFPAVMAALRATGYDGPLTAEMTPSRWDDMQAGRAASAALDRILAM
ncbi:MAG: sugar phosphate isomerase/epimerase [Eubacteriales bacterium]|nr:sugar phosphate isomerase/epimerase [Eubacteriales bacterium]